MNLFSTNDVVYTRMKRYTRIEIPVFKLIHVRKYTCLKPYVLQIIRVWNHTRYKSYTLQQFGYLPIIKFELCLLATVLYEIIELFIL